MTVSIIPSQLGTSPASNIGAQTTPDSGASGAAKRPSGKPAVTSRKSFAGFKKEHPGRTRWLEDEARMRASYLGDRRHLSPFLVPHRFEGRIEGKDLRRAKLGYGVGLNKAYLTEIFGHIRGAPARYDFGPLAQDGVARAITPKTTGGNDDDLTTAAPDGGHALELWKDITATGVSMRNFFEGEVLEWMASSVGGVIVADTNKPDDSPAITRADEKALGHRAHVKFVPFSAIMDAGIGEAGFRWLKLAEEYDDREPDDQTTRATPPRVVLYELLDDGSSQMARFGNDGKRVGDAVNLGQIVDAQGRPRLPITLVRFRKHPDMPAFLGSGLLMGLDDIVIDLYNTFSEMREAFRDACFSFFVYQGDNDNDVYAQFNDGSRLIRLGADEKAKLERVAVDSGEIDAGMKLLEQGVRNWVLSAKRQAEQSSQRAQAQSGIALVAEFQLDMKPLLVEVAETLDEIQRDVLMVMAQLLGASPGDAGTIRVERETSFRLEDEATRITRIIGEFVASLELPPEVKVQLTMKWVEATGLFDLDAPAPKDATVDGNDGSAPVEDGTKTSMQRTPAATPKTLRDLIEAQARELAESQQKSAVDSARMANKGPAGAGGALQDPAATDLGDFPNVAGA